MSAQSSIPDGYIDIFKIHRWALAMSHRGFSPLARTLMLAGNTIFSCSVPLSAQIGRGSIAEHRGLGIVIHPEAVIGDDVHVLPHVVLGGRGGGKPGAPVIEDGVTIGAGAKVLGPVRVGSGAKVGANSVVLRDVEPGRTVVGSPARPVQSR